MVNVLTEQLRADGYTILSEPRITGDGYYESAVADSEGNYMLKFTISLCVYFSFVLKSKVV